MRSTDMPRSLLWLCRRGTPVNGWGAGREAGGIPHARQTLGMTGAAAPTDRPAAKADNVAMIKVDAGPPAAPAEKPDQAGAPAPTNGKDLKAAHTAANGGLSKGAALRMLQSSSKCFVAG